MIMMMFITSATYEMDYFHLFLARLLCQLSFNKEINNIVHCQHELKFIFWNSEINKSNEI